MTEESDDLGIVGGETGDAEEDENFPQIRAIISLPEVEISTNEENENVLLKIRAKLYRFDRSCDPSEWKERGTGELKILRHKENNSIRVVMRRDKTFKVCANHFITPWMALKPCFNSDKAFIYTVAADFADETPKTECLAVKFGTIENAKLFHKKFEEAKVIVAKECCLYNGECDIEDSDSEEEAIRGKLSELSVNNKTNLDVSDLKLDEGEKSS